MRTEGTAGEKDIQTTGFFVFGALTLIVALLKLAAFSDWSWWRVSLPILIFVGFNIAYMVAGLGYLSFLRSGKHPPGTKATHLSSITARSTGARCSSSWRSPIMWFDTWKALRTHTGFGVCLVDLKRCSFSAVSVWSAYSCIGRQSHVP